MKKLNRKGFTLIELLAVIIILAIVVGITIPAVLTTTNKAKESAFKSVAEAAAEWFDKQYAAASSGLVTSGLATLDPKFADLCPDNASTCLVGTTRTKNDGTTYVVGEGTGKSPIAITSKEFITTVGLKYDSIQKMEVYINSLGRSCVILTSRANGDYVTSDYPAGSKAYAGQCKNTGLEK